MSHQTTKAPVAGPWLEGVVRPSYPSLAASLSTEVAIIGGGLTGIMTAYELSKAGKKVLLLEKDHIGLGATSLTTAFLTQVIDTCYKDLIRIHGPSKTSRIVQSHKAAIDFIEQMVQEEKIDCELKRRTNYLFAASPRDAGHLRKEAAAMRLAGLNAKMKKNDSLRFKNAGYLEIADQASFHPLKFLSHEAAQAIKNGAQIFEHTEVNALKGHTIETSHGTVHADWVIVSTYDPFNHPLGLFFKKAKYVSYVFEVKLPPGTFLEGLYQDSNNPYHYFKVNGHPNYDQLIIGGEDHRADIPVSAEKNFAALERYLQSILAGTPYTILRRWKGPILESLDGLPFIGSYRDPRTLYATGFSGNGMTYAAIAAILFRDIILDQKNDWRALYNPERRISLRSMLTKGRDYTEEFIHGALKNVFS